MDSKRITVFAGHYGSGKTNLALNYAVALRRSGKAVAAADLDIVNPYFRTKDGEKILASEGIKLISSEYANTNVDLPALPGEAYSIVRDRDTHFVVDLGGDDRGALALGRYTPFILEENDYDMLFVFNGARPLTRTATEAAMVLREIEAAGGLPFTGIVNNTNLGPLTEPGTILGGQETALELSRLTGLPVRMTGVEERLMERVQGLVIEPFPVSVLQLYYMLKEGI